MSTAPKTTFITDIANDVVVVNIPQTNPQGETTFRSMVYNRSFIDSLVAALPVIATASVTPAE